MVKIKTEDKDILLQSYFRFFLFFFFFLLTTSSAWIHCDIFVLLHLCVLWHAWTFIFYWPYLSSMPFYDCSSFSALHYRNSFGSWHVYKKHTHVRRHKPVCMHTHTAMYTCMHVQHLPLCCFCLLWWLSNNTTHNTLTPKTWPFPLGFALSIQPDAEEQQVVIEEVQSKESGCCHARICSGFLMLYRGWRTYMRYSVTLAGLALACLYMTVLGFDNITVGESQTKSLWVRHRQHHCAWVIDNTTVGESWTTSQWRRITDNITVEEL